MSTIRYAICGAGPVGLACAALLARHGVPAGEIALIDAKPLEQSLRDPRSIALSHASQVLLAGLGAWPLAATPIHQIHVSRAGRFGRTLIDRTEHALPALGHVTRYGAIVTALSTVSEQAGVVAMRPVKVLGLEQHAGHARLRLSGANGVETLLDANVVIQAEGGVFGEQSAKSVQREYAQTALVAHVRTGSPLSHRAYERFTDEGPLALLPQEEAGDDAATGSSYALVWCVAAGTAQRLLALADTDFLRELRQAFGGRLGSFVATGPRAAFPLGLNAHAPAASGNVVAIGNAAQTLHPVAGQGLNLGLRDAQVLARLLAREPAAQALAQFAALREADRGATIKLTDSMARLFVGNAASPLQTVLGGALGLLDAATPLKQAFAERMMWGRR
ncbi:MAG TPA: FAD-dependent monooxygenase [Burkholderiaceae bacterium]